MSDGRIGGDRFLFRGRRHPAALGWRWALFSVSRRTPYGSLRMPLSICVILRIYNEDAIYTHFPLAPLERRSRSLSLSSACRPFAPLFTLLISLSCSKTQVSSSSLLRSAKSASAELMFHDGNYPRATQDDVRCFANQSDNRSFVYLEFSFNSHMFWT